VIDWFTTAQVVVAVAAGLLCLVLGFAGRKPDDITLGATALVEVLLVAQLITAIVAPIFGNLPTGNLAEFYAYLISAVIVPPLAAFWALVERTRWSTVILGVACLAIAVMLYRMHVIWNVQLT
jgi:hypothetical protein